MTAPAQGSAPHVLVADDDRITVEILSRSLARWDYTVSTVGDGGAAWRFLEAAPGPTLAVLDWMMPELDGPEVCRRVRLERPHANIYLVLLTSLESRANIVAGLEAGADDYMVKPFDPDELRARIQVGARVVGLQARLSERVAELQEALSRVKYLQGLLPICSYCKRIRDDNQYWQSVEEYVVRHSDARFSHGICPACFAKAAQELDEIERSRSIVRS